MKRTLRTRAALATGVSLSLAGALAGCASTTSADTSSNDSPSTGDSSATSASDDGGDVVQPVVTQLDEIENENPFPDATAIGNAD